MDSNKYKIIENVITNEEARTVFMISSEVIQICLAYKGMQAEYDNLEYKVKKTIKSRINFEELDENSKKIAESYLRYVDKLIQ